ncbi:MAG: hypothetical protein SNG35_05245 [Rikenellaceae bacterium]
MKYFKLLSILMAVAICSCSESSSEETAAPVATDNTSTITIGDESPMLSLGYSSANNIKCCINSSWLRQNLVSIEASVTIEGNENAQDYYTRSQEATLYDWGLQITTVDLETGIFYLYLEAPLEEAYKELPAVLKILILDADGGETIAMRAIQLVDDVVSIVGIPQDSEAGETPIIEENTEVLPDFTGQVEIDKESGYYMANIYISGITDGNGGYLELKGTGEPKQNLWLEFDNTPKGIYIEKISEGSAVKNDIIFLVDNSGSMSEEANGIATSIQAWATELYEAGIDAKFACVGYNGSITGAIDLTDVSGISTYLDRYTGTSRTVGFDTTYLSEMASESTYKTTSGECGVVALRFADDLFSFRDGSNRIYVNFTDEPNQTSGYENNSVEYVNSDYWIGKGTVHTVFSATSCSTTGNNEDPRDMSTYTGGTSMDVSSSFTGVTLSSLPVSEAILNTYIIRFTNIEEYIGKESTYSVMIVVKDDGIESKKTSYLNF